MIDTRSGQLPVSSPSARRSRLVQAGGRRHAESRLVVGGLRAARGGRPAALEWRDLRLPLLGRLRAAAWLPTILLAASLVALVYLLQASGVATIGYDIQRLQSERDDWQLRNEQLRLELAKRRSLTWVEAEATGRLGMVRPEPTALTYVISPQKPAQ
jgi:cell division protein FtsL